MVGGLAVLLPIWIAWQVISLVFRLARDASVWIFVGFLAGPFGRPVLDWLGLDRPTLLMGGLEILPAWLAWGLSFFSVVLTLGTVYLAGALTAYLAGRRALAVFEALLERVPIVATVYRASKQVVELFTADKAQPFSKVLLVPFPNPSMRSIGFLTKETKDPVDGEPVYTVFLATTPNPTTGFLFIVKQADCVELPWTVEEGIRVVMSGGALAPDNLGTKTVPAVSAEMAAGPGSG